MSLGQQLEKVRAAEADVVLQHQQLLGHVDGFRSARDRLVTPGRIIGAGLALGYIAGRAAPALRNPQIKHDIEHGTDVLQRIARLASTAMPLLLPLMHQMQSRFGAAAPGQQAAGEDGHCA